jgi:hypothetical protein
VVRNHCSLRGVGCSLGEVRQKHHALIYEPPALASILTGTLLKESALAPLLYYPRHFFLTILPANSDMATAWVYDFIPAYRLTKDIVQGFLTELLQLNYDFGVTVCRSRDLQGWL